MCIRDREILVQLLNWRASVEMYGSECALSRWRDLSPSSCGTTVSWEMQGVRCRGVTAGIDDSGALLVNGERGRERIVGGELTWEV